MKKQLLSLTLLYAIPVIPSAAQPPIEEAAQVPNPDLSVQEAIGSVEFSELLPELTKIEEECRWYVSDQERAEVLAALGYLLARGQLNKNNFNEKTKLVIAQMIAQRAFNHARNHVYNQSAMLIANSIGENAKVELEKKNANKALIINAYSGWNLQYKATTAAHHPTYIHDRHCNGWN